MDHRFRTLKTYFKEKYGYPLYKVALDTGLNCPNRDGTKATGGCIFCCQKGSGDFAITYHGQPLDQQQFIYNHQNAKKGQYIAYFQAWTNTYAPKEKLAYLFSQALSNPWFKGISIATRPDCLSQEIIDMLLDLQKQYPDKWIWIELGLQTIHEKSAQWMNRAYSLQEFEACMERLTKTQFQIIIHVIVGLPLESRQDMIDTIEYLNQYPYFGIKLQLLHYLDHSRLGQLYLQNPNQFSILTLEEYADLIAELIGHLRQDIVVHRISGDGDEQHLLAPLWSKDKRRVHNQILKRLKEKQIIQGCLRRG